MTKQTDNTKAFIKANATVDVITGNTTEKGTMYRLVDGQVFNLTTEEVASMPEPRWFGMY